MSNKLIKAERSRAKDIRQGVIEQTPTPSKDRKGAKPYKIVGTFMDRELTVGRYKTLAQAQEALHNMERKKLYFKLRIVQ